MSIWFSTDKSSAPTVLPPVAGIDRIVLTSPRLPFRVAQGITIEGFRNLPGYRTGVAVPTKRNSSHKMMVRLHPRRTGDPYVELYYGPAKPSAPACQIVVHAPPGGYADDLTRPLSLVGALEKRLRWRFVITELEIALDFEGDCLALRYLQRQFYVPRTTRHFVHGSMYWGTGRSARQWRSYQNLTFGTPRARFEIVVRSSALRALALRHFPDLVRKTFLGYVERSFQLLDARLPQRANATAVMAFLHSVHAVGTTIAILAVPARKRTRLRGYLQQSSADKLARNALADLRRRLKP